MKRVAIILLQLVVTAAGLWYVFHEPNKRAQVAEALREADKTWLMIAWICYGAVELLATVRWQILLRLQNITLSWWRTGGFVMIGLFFNMFLPGLIGGDVMRLYLVFKQAPRKKTRATLSVAMDRLFGLISILFLAGMSFWFRSGWLKQSPATWHIAQAALVVLGVGLAFSTLLFVVIGVDFANRFPKRFPLRGMIAESAEALKCYSRDVWTLLLLFLITIGSHLAYYVTFYCAGRSLHQSAKLSDVLSIMPLVNAVTSLPVSFGGVGVRETLFQELLGNLAHVPEAIAALTASLGFAVQASWGLVGAAVYLLARKISRR